MAALISALSALFICTCSVGVKLNQKTVRVCVCMCACVSACVCVWKFSVSLCCIITRCVFFGYSPLMTSVGLRSLKTSVCVCVCVCVMCVCVCVCFCVFLCVHVSDLCTASALRCFWTVWRRAPKESFCLGNPPSSGGGRHYASRARRSSCAESTHHHPSVCPKLQADLSLAQWRAIPTMLIC